MRTFPKKILSQFKFTLGRSLDLSLPSNQQILAICVMSFFFRTLYFTAQGFTVSISVVSSIFTSLSVFLAWAVMREVAPDQPQLALIVAGVQILVTLAIGYPSFLLLIFQILMMRVINQCTGNRRTFIDGVVIIGLAVFVFANFSLDLEFDEIKIATLIVLAVGVLLQIPQKQIQSVKDNSSELLNSKKVRIANVFLFLSSLLFVSFGLYGYQDVSPVLIASIVLLIQPIYTLLRRS